LKTAQASQTRLLFECEALFLRPTDVTESILNDAKDSFDKVVRDLKKEAWKNRHEIIGAAAKAGLIAF
jgi:hypothetical protein